MIRQPDAVLESVILDLAGLFEPAYDSMCQFARVLRDPAPAVLPSRVPVIYSFVTAMT